MRANSLPRAVSLYSGHAACRQHTTHAYRAALPHALCLNAYFAPSCTALSALLPSNYADRRPRYLTLLQVNLTTGHRAC